MTIHLCRGNWAIKDFMVNHRGDKLQYLYQKDGNLFRSIAIQDGKVKTTTRLNKYFQYNHEQQEPIHYYFIGDQRFAKKSGKSPVNFLLLDHLSSPRMEVTEDGKVVKYYDYQAFGQLSQRSNALKGNHFGFAGSLFNEASQLYQMKTRFYDPQIGRFISPDLYMLQHPGKVLESPIEGNLYSYARNDPVNFWDPSGQKVFVKSRPVNGYFIAAHTYIEVDRGNGDNIVRFEGFDSGGKLAVKTYSFSKTLAELEQKELNQKFTSSIEIKPPDGMSQKEWDNRVIKSGEYFVNHISSKRDYKLFGGDNGMTSGNCHSVSRGIIDHADRSTAKQLDSYDPPYLDGYAINKETNFESYQEEKPIYNESKKE